ncbi:uncharacterized protein LOC144136528 isoform X2 [Amblyomma americanum]
MDSAATPVSTGTKPGDIPLRLTVRMLTKQVISVETFSSDTVLDLKMQLQDTVGYPADQLKLIFTRQGSEPVLEDSDTLVECGITDGSELYLIISVRSGYYPHLMPKEPEPVKLSIRIRRGKCVVVKTRRSATVGSVKHSIEKQTELPAAKQILTYCGKAMSDKMTLAHYGIRDRCVVQLSMNNSEDGSLQPTVEDGGLSAPNGILRQLRQVFFLITRIFYK